RMAHSLNSPHVVKVYDVGLHRSGAFAWIALERLGESLRDWIKRPDPLSWPKAASIVADILLALDAAHGKGLLHGDIKPDNVLCDGSRWKVVDFGIARYLIPGSGPAGEELIQGTIGYIAPEILCGGKNTSQSDLYSVGVCLLELLTKPKERPFRTE